MSESEKKFHSIGEVSKMFDINPSKLRFWEKTFPKLQPYKNQKGTRFYSQDDIALIRQILYLTDECGYTLEGARDQLKNAKVNDERMQIVQNLTEVRDFLLKLKEEL